MRSKHGVAMTTFEFNLLLKLLMPDRLTLSCKRRESLLSLRFATRVVASLRDLTSAIPQ